MRFRILGPVEIPNGRHSPAIGRRRERCLLGILLLEVGRVVTADRLIDLLWDDAKPGLARQSIQSHVARLRAVLEFAPGEALVAGRGGYSLQVDPDAVDAHRFRALVAAGRVADDLPTRANLFEQALDLWRGTVMQDSASDRLRDRIAGDLAAIRLDVTEELLTTGIALGCEQQLLPMLARMCTEHPARERFVELHMTALRRVGRDAEALAVYGRARSYLVDELGLEPGPRLRGLQVSILRQEPEPGPEPASPEDLLPADPRAGARPHTIVGGAGVPHQLPTGIRHFTGRLAELEVVGRLAADPGDTTAAGGTVVISAIDGMAGIGKTALAVHAAHRLAGYFPDGQLFIDLHGYTQGYEPRTPGSALEALLRALDVSAQRIPDDVEERAALYRQRLAGTRTLIVLDNAASEAQVHPLLPASAGCLVLVTSRRRLKGLDDAYPLPLDVLSQAEALVLLHAVAGSQGGPADDVVLAEIAELCGRLPLALRIAGAWLRHRLAWTPRHLVDLLRDQTERVGALADGERDLRTVFDLSYAHLSGPQQALFRQLGMVPGPDVDAYAAAALAGTDPATATRLLEDLVDHNLLLHHVAGRYRLHDLLRAHARTRANHDPAHDRQAALDRLLDYYQHTANRADTLVTPYPRPAAEGPVPAYRPPLPDQNAAWLWLRAERANLLASLQPGTTDRRTIVLINGLATLLITDGPWADAIALHAAAATAAHHLGDRSGRAYALFHQADIRLLTCDYPRADRDLREALDLCQALNDRRGQANALSYRGYLRTMIGDHLGAAADLHAALRMYRDISERLGQANALIRLARVQISVGDHPSALQSLQEGLDLCHDLDDHRGEAYVLCNLAEIKLVTHDYPGVAQDLHEALRLFRGLGDDNGEAIAHGYLGQLGTLTGDYPKAIQHLESAIDVYRRTGARGNEAWALNHYAAAITATGDHSRGLSLYQTALQLSQEVHHPDDEAHALEGIAELHFHTGDAETATTDLKRALDMFRHLAMASDVDRVQARLTALSGWATPSPHNPPAT